MSFSTGIRRCLTPCLWLLCAGAAWAAPLALDGEGWTVAMDPLNRGADMGWQNPPKDWNRAQEAPAQGWDAATVPHCWTVDPRFGEYTGVMWYRRSFIPPASSPGEDRWQLTFDAVGERCRVWVNGRDFGAHESAGVPVRLDVTSAIEPGKQNLVAVAVDNAWDAQTIPGARTGTRPNDQLYPWINYGGLLGPVTLEALPAARVALQKIEAVPQDGGKARVGITLFAGPDGFGKNAAIDVEIFDPSSPGRPLAGARAVPAADAASVSAIIDLSGVRRWTLADPRLYESRATLRRDGAPACTHSAMFGVRDIRVADAQFLLNGEPVHLAGANRARGEPVLGGIDTAEAVERDLRLMKDAGLRFARLQHYPVNRHVLEWADKNGMLLIVEYPMWGLMAPDLADPVRRERYRAGMAALMREAWNHPSVAAWSVGNEYASWTPEGVAWTKDMIAYVKSLDKTRPVTFAALSRALSVLKQRKQPETQSLNDVDFLSVNFYLKPEAVAPLLDLAHATWPGKPVFISEFGLRADRVQDEQERLDYFDRMFAIVRERPWICGLSFWSFNDYPSRYPGTGMDGYRRWGLVDEFRQMRPLYHHVQQALQTSGWETPGGQ